MHKEPNVTSNAASTSSLYLLVSLFLSLMVLPLLEGLYVGRLLTLLGLTSTFIIGAVVARSRLRLTTFVLLIVALPAAWATLFVDSKPLFVAHCLLGSMFFWLVGGVVVYVVIKTYRITLDSVFGAISAYLLFGLAWALSYWAVYTVSPNVISFSSEQRIANGDELREAADFSKFVYFSFVTMATLGYGDITPFGRIARTLAWIQTVTGQFYVAVVIAWLVSALPRPGDDTR